MRVFITGGAGFVGSSLAKLWRENFPKSDIVVLDNLKRRGSELNLKMFREYNIDFVHGDIRDLNDLMSIEGNFDVFIEASAEPSVHAGLNGNVSYLLQTNLMGTLNCLEFAKKKVDKMIFLSTSRVYSLQALKTIPLKKVDQRLVLSLSGSHLGLSDNGIAENFTTSSARSLYGATKLASELIIQEYCYSLGIKAIINRCGVIAGPGQFGKVDQGVFTLWVANHVFQKPLSYFGYGGKGYQVRDLLHPSDLYDLILLQLENINSYNGDVFNVGGGNDISVSLSELTDICQKITDRKVSIKSIDRDNPVDIPYYISDTRKVQKTFNWQPKKDIDHIIYDIYTWIIENHKSLKPIFT